MPNLSSSVAMRVASVARATLPLATLGASGRVLYTPTGTLLGSPPIYFLGLNPGEDANDGEDHSRLTVGADLLRLENNQIREHAYLDERWKQSQPGQAPIQLAGRTVFSILCGGDGLRGDELLRRTPISNFILQRSSSEASLVAKTREKPVALAEQCWPFHQAVIDETRCQVVLTHAVGVAREFARGRGLGEGHQRPSGWGGKLSTLYAWQLQPGVRLLAMPNLSRYKPDGPRAPALAAFFEEFGPDL